MILVAVGTQKYQFNRLLSQIQKIEEEFIVQKGYTLFQSKHENFKFSKKLDSYFLETDLVIAHAGVGISMLAFEYNKPLIVVPRLKKYDEHIDDHQLELCAYLKKNNLALVCHDINDLNELIKKAKTYKFNKYQSNTDEFNNQLISLIKEL